MPMDAEDRLRLLSMVSTSERLAYEKELLQTATSGNGGCNVM